MIKVIVIKDFTLDKFNGIKNLERFDPRNNKPGRLYINDIFECDYNIAKCLTGKNSKKKIVVKVIEVTP